MNIRRGFFRLWLVFGLLWIVVIGVFGLDQIAKDRWWTGDQWWEKDPMAFLPVRCEEARGTINVDYEKLDAFEAWNQYRNPSQACFYTHDKFRVLWPEYNDLAFIDISRKLYTHIGWAPEFDGDRFERTKKVALVAVIPPLVLLIVGSLIAWAIAGFRPPTTKQG